AAKIPAHPEQGGVVAYSAVKRLLIGRPLSSREFEQQRLPKRLALGVFSTDAIASTAFATQEILVVLVPAAGMAALGYLVPISLLVVALRGHEVELAVALIVIIATGNLRGVRESGRLFAPPTYVYVSTMTLLVVWGLFRTFTGDLQPLPVNHTQLAHFTGGGAMLGG